MKVTVSYPKPKAKSFNVKGKSIPEVFKSLNKNAFWGRYRSDADIDWGKDDPVKKADITAAPYIILPTWTDYSKATKDEKKSWDDMMKALEKHENNHHKIFEDAVEEFKKSIEKRDDLSAKDAKALWKDFLKDTQDAQDKYDTRTKHGEKEGVELVEP